MGTSTFLNFYAVDWLVFLLLSLHLWMVGNQWRLGFLFGAAASFFGFIFGFMTGSVAVILMNIVFGIMHVRAYMKWSEATDGQV